jgi:hypothetical protein
MDDDRSHRDTGDQREQQLPRPSTISVLISIDVSVVFWRARLS